MRLTWPWVFLSIVVSQTCSQGQFDELTRKQVNLIEYKNENYGADGYEFYYETDDGTLRQEKGSFVGEIWTVVGKSVWMDPNGKIYISEYTADDKGYNVRLSEMFTLIQPTGLTTRPAFPSPGVPFSAPASYPAPRPQAYPARQPQVSKESLASLLELNGLLEPSAKRKFMRIRMR